MMPAVFILVSSSALELPEQRHAMVGMERIEKLVEWRIRTDTFRMPLFIILVGGQEDR